MSKKFIQIVCLVSALWSPTAFGLNFPSGSWVGRIKFDGQENKFAVKLDTITYQPNDLDQSPVFQMHFRIGLGGLTSPEYFSQYYESVIYNFDTQYVTLDTPENDLVIMARVEKLGALTLLNGHVFSRSTAVSGTISLKFLSDEPEDGPTDAPARDLGAPDNRNFDGDPDLDTALTAGTLSGQYEGLCGHELVAIQIETARGLGEKPDPLFPGLSAYTIMGRLGLNEPFVCALNEVTLPEGEKDWCTYRSYSSGTYNMANGLLTLDGPSTSQNCSLLDGNLICSVRLRPMSDTPITNCALKKVPAPATGVFKPFSRQFSIPTTADQRAELPGIAPPASTELVTALDGMFSGFLHHETSNLYQPMRMKVVATVSTVNPHNLNMVYISGATILHFDKPNAPQPLIWSQRFERKSFYVKNGFILDDHNSDSFIQIDSWKKGLISGVLFSRQFGRVGTIQLVKAGMPALDPRAKIVANPIGNFSGPSLTGPIHNFWWLQTTPTVQSIADGSSTFRFHGEVGTNGGIILRMAIAQGSYDFFTQALGFTVMDGDSGQPRLFTGHVYQSFMSLFWPGAPRAQIRMPANHDELTYDRQP